MCGSSLRTHVGRRSARTDPADLAGHRYGIPTAAGSRPCAVVGRVGFPLPVLPRVGSARSAVGSAGAWGNSGTRVVTAAWLERRHCPADRRACPYQRGRIRTACRRRCCRRRTTGDRNCELPRRISGDRVLRQRAAGTSRADGGDDAVSAVVTGSWVSSSPSRRRLRRSGSASTPCAARPHQAFSPRATLAPRRRKWPR